MELTAGTMVHEDCVLQTHPGTCHHCGKLTHGILIGGSERHWYSADLLSGSRWRIHACNAKDAGVTYKPKSPPEAA